MRLASTTTRVHLHRHSGFRSAHRTSRYYRLFYSKERDLSTANLTHAQRGVEFLLLATGLKDSLAQVIRVES